MIFSLNYINEEARALCPVFSLFEKNDFYCILDYAMLILGAPKHMGAKRSKTHTDHRPFS